MAARFRPTVPRNGSGTKSELLAKTKKLEKSVNYLLDKHMSTDENWDDQAQREKEKKAIDKAPGEVG